MSPISYLIDFVRFVFWFRTNPCFVSDFPFRFLSLKTVRWHKCPHFWLFETWWYLTHPFQRIPKVCFFWISKKNNRACQHLLMLLVVLLFFSSRFCIQTSDLCLIHVILRRKKAIRYTFRQYNTRKVYEFNYQNSVHVIGIIIFECMILFCVFMVSFTCKLV